jgi:hypothetical protein
MRKKTLNVLAAFLLLLAMLVAAVPVFAAEEDNTQSVNSNTSTSVEIQGASSTFTVRVPKKLTGIGTSGTVSYGVSVSGDIAGDKQVSVVPDTSVTLKQDEAADVIATIAQDKTTWAANEFKTSAKGSITYSNIIEGSYTGSFHFTIALQDWAGSSDSDSEEDDDEENTSAIPVKVVDSEGSDLNASASYITGDDADKLLEALVESGAISSADDVDLLVDITTDDFDDITTATFDVSSIASPGDKVAILHFNTETNSWELIGIETVKENSTVSGNFSSYSPVAFVVVNDDEEFQIQDVFSTLEAGLYDANNNLLCKWSDAGINIAVDYTYSNYNTETASAYYVITNKYPTTAKIIVQDGINKIGNYAFMGCSNVTRILLPETITSIGNYAFRSTGVKQVEIPSSYSIIPECAYQDCVNLVNVIIPDNIVTIKDNAFKGCTNIKSVYLPKTTTSIWCKTAVGNSENKTYAPFYGCKNLDKIYTELSSKSSNWGSYYAYKGTTVDAYTVYNTTKDSYQLGLYFQSLSGDVTLPNTITSIPDGACYYNTSITSITIPSTVTSIGKYAFYMCTNLSNINFQGDLSTIGDYAFYRCNSLTSINIPSGITSLGKYTFWSCGNLQSVTLPDTLTTIGDECFEYCRNLTNVVFSENITSVGPYAFQYCSGLTTLNLPDSLTTIDYYAFAYCTSLDTINWSHSLDKIGLYAFKNCKALTYVILPDSLTYINAGAFSNCTGLKAIYIPTSVTTIVAKSATESPFYEDSGNLNIYCEVSAKQSGWGSYWNYVTDSSTAYITYGMTNNDVNYWCTATLSGDIIIPEGITLIPSGIFVNNTTITSVTFSSSILYIRSSAFSGCTNLSSITLNENLSTIAVKAFNNCTSLSNIWIPESVTTIVASSVSSATFYGCSKDLVINCEASSRPSGWGPYWNYYSDNDKLTVNYGVSQ